MYEFTKGQTVVFKDSEPGDPSMTVEFPEHPADPSLVGVQWGRSGVQWFRRSTIFPA